MKTDLALLVAVTCAAFGCSSGQGGARVRQDASATGSGGVGASASGGSGGSPAGGASGGAVASGGGGGFAGTTATGGNPSVSGGAGGSGGGASGGKGADGGASGAGGSAQPLGMNDVTILVPLPQAGAEPVLFTGADLAADGSALVSHSLFDRVVTDVATGKPMPGLDTTYGKLQLVAVRFDLCDRHLPGPCPDSEDGRMRLVFQPISTQGSADDVGFHAFYAIPKAEIPAAIRELRALAALNTSQDGVLRVSAALVGASRQVYAGKVRAFVKHYGGDAALVRLTMNARSFIAAALVWGLRGVEKKGGAFVDIPIVGSTEIAESVTLVGTVGFDTRPVADTPTGLQGVLTQLKFDAADAAAKRASMAALVAVDNPLTNTAETVPCVACHVATVVMSARASSAGIDPLALPGRYTSKFDLSVAGGASATNAFTIRALGYVGTQAMISQRVVNETAQTLMEIEQRYPGP